MARSIHFAVPLLFVLVSGPACGLNTEFARQHLQEGESALRERQLDVAIAELEQAVKLDPALVEGHTRLGIAYKERGDLPAAAESLETAVKLDPFSFLAMFELGEVYRLMQKFERAVRAYVLAVKLSPSDFDARFRLAMCYHESGDYERATQAYEDAVELDPSNPHAWSNLGALHDTQGHYYEAISAYKQSLECDTRQPVVLVNLATVYIHQERYATAMKALETALGFAPDLAIAHERMGYCRWRTAQMDAAAESYREAIELGDEAGRAHAGLGVVLMTQYLKDPQQVASRDQAIEAWHRSLELDPEQPNLRALIEKYRVRQSPPLLSIED